jgi:hypothetical protein
MCEMAETRAAPPLIYGNDSRGRAHRSDFHKLADKEREWTALLPAGYLPSLNTDVEY